MTGTHAEINCDLPALKTGSLGLLGRENKEYLKGGLGATRSQDSTLRAAVLRHLTLRDGTCTQEKAPNCTGNMCTQTCPHPGAREVTPTLPQAMRAPKHLGKESVRLSKMRTGLSRVKSVACLPQTEELIEN